MTGLVLPERFAPVDFVVNNILEDHLSPQYRINGGAWKNVVIDKAVQVNEGDTIQLRVTTPPTPGFNTIHWKIKVGTLSVGWQVFS